MKTIKLLLAFILCLTLTFCEDDSVDENNNNTEQMNNNDSTNGDSSNNNDNNNTDTPQAKLGELSISGDQVALLNGNTIFKPQSVTGNISTTIIYVFKVNNDVQYRLSFLNVGNGRYNFSFQIDDDNVDTLSRNLTNLAKTLSSLGITKDDANQKFIFKDVKVFKFLSSTPALVLNGELPFTLN